MKLEELSFYRWKESNGFDDIIFLIDINSTSAPGVLQCWSLEMKSINSDMIEGRMYNYKYELKDKDNYDIEKLSIDDVDKSFFFACVFHGRVKLK